MGWDKVREYIRVRVIVMVISRVKVRARLGQKQWQGQGQGQVNKQPGAGKGGWARAEGEEGKLKGTSLGHGLRADVNLFGSSTTRLENNSHKKNWCNLANVCFDNLTIRYL